MRANRVRRNLIGWLLAGALSSACASGEDTSPASAMTSEVIDSFPDVVSGPTLKPAPHWPVWIKDYRCGTRTNESSAVEYLGRDGATRVFLIADDTGEFHVARVSQPGDTGRVALELEPVKYGRSLIDGLRDYPEWDFEALAVAARRPRGAFDAKAIAGVEMLLATEGRGRDFRTQTSVVSIRLSPNPEAAPTGRRSWIMEMTGEPFANSGFFRRYAAPNRGIEGLAIGGRRVFLGFGELVNRGEVSSQGTLLFVVDRATNHVALLPTRAMSIRSICGLDAIGDSISALVDRDRMELVVMQWENSMTGVLRACFRFPLDLPAPAGFRYSVPSVEGIAVDDEGDFWLVTDPWEGHYRPVGAAPETLHVYLEARMPMLYRMDGAPAWAAAGLARIWPGDSSQTRR